MLEQQLGAVHEEDEFNPEKKRKNGRCLLLTYCLNLVKWVSATDI